MKREHGIDSVNPVTGKVKYGRGWVNLSRYFHDKKNYPDIVFPEKYKRNQASPKANWRKLVVNPKKKRRRK